MSEPAAPIEPAHGHGVRCRRTALRSSDISVSRGLQLIVIGGLIGSVVVALTLPFAM